MHTKRNTNESGQGMIEYALILVLLAIVALVVLAVLGPEIKAVINQLQCALPNIPPEVICAVTN